ncbi:uncharacterized protein F4817DRAFT_316528 [Daldinia loculata]|uniref:uncharacterized protein n=1 Tax=Daldinia loculata TaxID=103429 RepID=UPI0020C37146|nr:uncharacterized protein F4817DRAFT_316528 [Daldinia loculata]KAI1646809.1 hypothetical protein F4817DRAFT_316528 [Daldinia loculata]
MAHDERNGVGELPSKKCTSAPWKATQSHKPRRRSSQQRKRTLPASGQLRGGPAAIAQSEHDRQHNFISKASEIARKPVNQITKEDAAQARAFGKPPGKGSTAAGVQSLADQNAKSKEA